MNKNIKKAVLSALLLSIGYLLPLVTMQVKELGTALLPMHLPVLIGGFIIGPLYGALIGLLLPMTRSLIFGMPPLYPNALSMSVELFFYGLISGIVFNLFRKLKINQILSVIISLLIAMIFGRIFYMVSMIILGIYPLTSEAFTLLFTNTVLECIPGIIIQIILVPTLVLVLIKTKIYEKIQR